MSTQTYTPEILEVHQAFQLDYDPKVMLKEAEKLLKGKSTTPTNKGTRLANLGFSSAKGSAVEKQTPARGKRLKKEANIIQHYQQKYPLCKFILESDYKKVCKKYKLISGGVSHYKGFVPQTNLREIEQFKVDIEDRKIRVRAWGSASPLSFSQLCEKYNLTEKQRANILEGGVTRKTIPYTRWDGQKTTRISAISLLGLDIAAPKSDMKLRWNERIRGNEIVAADPIVTMPVRGGRLIVTAWGDEASDVKVVNTKMN